MGCSFSSSSGRAWDFLGMGWVWFNRSNKSSINSFFLALSAFAISSSSLTLARLLEREPITSISALLLGMAAGGEEGKGGGE